MILMCPKCKEAGDLLPSVRRIDQSLVETRKQAFDYVRELHDQCSFVGCTCQHRIPEIEND